MLCWFKSLDIHRACIMLCVCFYLKLILRINRFRICRIIVTHQDKAWDKNKLLTNNFFRIQLRSWNCFGIFNLVRSTGSRPWDNGGEIGLQKNFFSPESLPWPPLVRSVITEKNTSIVFTSMSCTLEPAIQSCDIGQRIPFLHLTAVNWP